MNVTTPECDLFLWCTTPSFDQHAMLSAIAEDKNLRVEQKEGLRFVRLEHQGIECLIIASGDRFTIQFNDKQGRQREQSMAAAYVHGFLGQFANDIVGNWHVKFDFAWREDSNHFLNMDDFPKGMSYAQVVQEFCKVD